MVNEDRTDTIAENRPASSQAFTFSLPTLFYLTTVYAISMHYGIGACALTTCVLLAWWAWHGPPPSAGRKNVRTLIATLAFFALVLAGLLPMTHSIRGQHSGHIYCLNDLRQLSLAILNYEYENKHLPPAFIADETGKPIHNWRVLILPYIEQANLYETYNFDEPWDGPNNIKLLNQIPSNFQCKHNLNSSRFTQDGTTTYKLVTGDGTAFVGAQTKSSADIADGTSNSLMIVEDFANPVPWTKPDDLTIDEVTEIFEGVNQRDRSPCCAHEIDSHFKRVLQGNSTTCFDGSTHSLGPSCEPEKIRWLCTIADGHRMSIDDLNCGPQIIHKPAAWAILASYVALLLLPCWIFRRRSVSTVHRPSTIDEFSIKCFSKR